MNKKTSKQDFIKQDIIQKLVNRTFEHSLPPLAGIGGAL